MINGLTLDEQLLYMEIAVALDHDARQDRAQARGHRRATAQKVGRVNDSLKQVTERAARKVKRFRYCKRNRAYGLGKRSRASVRVRLTRQLASLQY